MRNLIKRREHGRSKVVEEVDRYRNVLDPLILHLDHPRLAFCRALRGFDDS
jgi:hypothetical protein